MKRALLIFNTASGNAGTLDHEEMSHAFRRMGLSLDHVIELPNDALPERSFVEQMGFEIVAIISGDGTVAGTCEKLSGWSGTLLVLPGGTMNLLSRRLHGEIGLAELFDKLVESKCESVRVPVVFLDKQEVLTGLTVGPSTRWGEVREVIRQGDVAGLVQAVPDAWSDTLADEGVWVEGLERQAYASIFIEPNDGQSLSVIAFRANNIGDMLGHGVAWLRRDFREGPRDELGFMHEVKVVGDKLDTGLLIDGEYEDGQLPLVCSAGMSSVLFMRMK